MRNLHISDDTLTARKLGKIFRFSFSTACKHPMSAQSISLGLPDPFLRFPSHVATPLTGVVHVSATQQLNSGSTGTLYASECLSPFILNYAATATGAFTLPDAFSLSQAYGNSLISTAVSNLIPYFSQLPSSQVQVGDVFQIGLDILSTSSQGVVFSAGTGGSGTHSTPAYAAGGRGNADSLVVQFTAVGPTLATCTYTLQ